HVVAGDAHRSRGLGQCGGQDRDRGGLAGAVRPEECEQFTFGHLEAHPCHGRAGGLLVLLEEVVHLDDCCHVLLLAVCAWVVGSTQVIQDIRQPSSTPYHRGVNLM